MSLRIGSLCSGCEGLGLAVQAVLGGELAWVADNDPGAAKILAHHFPSVPNLGDITETDWAQVEPVDVLIAGFPCQDISCAGKRAGLREGTRSGIWSHVARAIAALRPPLVVIENVKELLSERADSDVEQCPWCLGDTDSESAVRALGAVLADLAEIGFDAEWVSLPAAAIGACHLRWRVFIVAWPAADTAGGRRTAGSRCGDRRLAPVGGEAVGRPHDGAAEDANGATRHQRRLAAPGQAESGRPRPDAGGPGGAPAADSHGGRLAELAECDRRPFAGFNGTLRDDPERCGDAPADPAGDGWDEMGAGPDLNGRTVVAECGDSSAGGGRVPSDARSEGLPLGEVEHHGPERPAAERGGRDDSPWSRPGAFGRYEAAVRRHEHAFGRLVPSPVVPGRNGDPRLSPAFVEWMQGLPEGWVTDVPGLSRNAQLKALGNGVVPQQAAMALRILLGAIEAGEAA